MQDTKQTWEEVVYFAQNSFRPLADRLIARLRLAWLASWRLAAIVTCCPLILKDLIFKEKMTIGFHSQLHMENVKMIQAGYNVQPLSAFLDLPSPKAARAIDFVKPLNPEKQKTSPEFYNLLNFVIQFCPPYPSEKKQMERFARIGAGAGKNFDASKFSPEMRTAITQGMADALTEYAALQKQIDEKKVISGQMFGTRDYLKNNYF